MTSPGRTRETPATMETVRHALHMIGVQVLPWSTSATRAGLRLRQAEQGRVDVVADWDDPQEATRQALWIASDLRRAGWVCDLDGTVVTVQKRITPSV